MRGERDIVMPTTGKDITCPLIAAGRGKGKGGRKGRMEGKEGGNKEGGKEIYK